MVDLHPHALPACPLFDAKVMDGSCDRNGPVLVLNEVRRGAVQDIAVLCALLARGWNGGNQAYLFCSFRKEECCRCVSTPIGNTLMERQSPLS
jgi:hypothetical protein